ncbi:hypothetical protein GJAV_G00111220 [Gymnothorax javanicus]|nr:hypothetical protein GJAV_G00111220 [Gymnothorax javanicus]
MTKAIDSLLQKHNGQRDILRLVDKEYAAMLHQSAADPNSLLHPTTRLHISSNLKHQAKLLNTSSSLNTSSEKIRDSTAVAVFVGGQEMAAAETEKTDKDLSRLRKTEVPPRNTSPEGLLITATVFSGHLIHIRVSRGKMAFHSRLSLAQKIFLAIFCFPLLPFYLCYACCCATDDEQEKDEEKEGENRLEQRVKANAGVNDVRNNKGNNADRNGLVYKNEGAVDIELARKASGSLKKISNKEHQDKAVNDDSRNDNVVTVEIHPHKSTQKLPARLSFGKGKKVQRSDIVYENEAAVDIEKRPKTSSLPKKKSSHGGIQEAIKSEDNIGKEVRRNDVVIENEGFADANKKTKLSHKTEFAALSLMEVSLDISNAYPWDKSSLKSMHIDLDKLKHLDAYSSKVRPRDTVEALVLELLKRASSDLEKLRAIWMWVTHHIAYDVEGLRNPNLRSSSSADVLRSGKAVCAGYAGIFQEMCRIAGIECERVSGYSKGAGYEVGNRFTGDTDHAWNAVRLGGSWHLLDSTWGAGRTNGKFSFQYNEFYFLTHPALFVGDHFPEDEKWQLLTPRMSLKQYENLVHKKSDFYNLGLISSHPEKSPILSDGKTTVTVQSSSPTLFLAHLNGKRNCGIMTLRPYEMSLDVYPESTGLQTLEIYAKDGVSADEESYHLVCSYQLQCRRVSGEMRPPADLLNPVGPSWVSERKGLREPSQPDPLVLAPDGRCSFRFRVAAHLDLMAMLTAANFSMTDDQQRRHIFQSKQQDWVDFKVQVPRVGLYVLKVYAKDKADKGSYSYVCNYLISCTNPRIRWPVYPLTYASWKDDYELVEPLAGILPANRSVQFKMMIPNVSQVSISGSDTHDLSQDADGYWTGSCSTAGSKDLNVMIQINPNDRTWSFILTYQVET